MLITTEYRSHWIDSAGRRHAQRYPFHAGQLQPVVNLDEVRAWIDLATSGDMLRAGFPGNPDDPAVFYVGQFLRADQKLSEHDRIGALLCAELTDDVPRYHSGWRAPFVAMRERWPLPALGGACVILNLTPHPVTVHEVTLSPSGTVARATEESTPAAPISLSIPDPAGAPADRIEFAVPTSTTRYTGLVDLPAPEPGVYLIVSMVAARAAAERGRWTGDLLVPGEQVRDSAGRIIGCRSLARVTAP